MEPLEPSGYCYPNGMARIYIESLRDVIGQNGLRAVLRLAGLGHLLTGLPPDDLNREFDFASYSGLNGALDEVYGQRGSRGLQLRAGGASFARGLERFGAPPGTRDLAADALSLDTKLRTGLSAMAKAISDNSDEAARVEDCGDHYIYVSTPCPVCWGRHSEAPICFATVGFLQAALSWLTGGCRFKLEETACAAAGYDACEFAVYKEPIG